MARRCYRACRTRRSPTKKGRRSGGRLLRSTPQSACQDTNDNEHEKNCGQKQLEVIFGVPTRAIGTMAGAVVKQREIDRTAVQNAVDNTDTLPDAYDDRQQQVHDTREVA